MKKIILALLFIAFIPYSAGASDGNADDVILNADDMQNDDLHDILTAKGNVSVSNGTQILEADEVIYNKKTKIFKATGNVRVFDIDGNKIYAKYAEVSDKFEFGFLQNGRITTADKEFIAATKARREESSVYYSKGVYSPCLVCQECDDYNPLWQLKAEKIHYDEEEHEVKYRNVFMEIKGVPVFYTPYFKHPDPTVKRKTGILAPSFGNNTQLGMFFGAPVYVALNDHSDMTITPYYFSKQNPAVSGEYRHRFRKASLDLGGSITKIKPITGAPGQEELKPGQYHGHYYGDFKWNINENWRMKTFYIRTTNPTYLKRYHYLGGEKYVHKNVLTSTFDTEYFNKNDYISFKGYHFQNLRADIDNRAVPDVLPVTEFSFERPAVYGSYFMFDANTMSIKRNKGAQVNRITGDVSWVAPYTNDLGMNFEGLANVRSDLYDISKYTPPGHNQPVKQVRGRVVPGTMLTWKWPFYSKIYSSKVILEPIVSGVLQPTKSGSDKIPNEDSQDFELDTLSLFKLNRFNGYDLLDSGQRVNYGLNLKFSTVNSVNTHIFLGQSYSFSKTTDFPEDAGIREKGSDYIGKVRIVPQSYFYLDWSARFDRDSGSVKRSIVKLNAGVPVFNIDVDYFYQDHSFLSGQFGPREQVTARANSKFTETWSGYIKGVRQIKPRSERLEEAIGVVYSDECFKLSLEGAQKHYQDRDIKPEKTIMLTFGFKNLGEFSTGRLSGMPDSGLSSN